MIDLHLDNTAFAKLVRGREKHVQYLRDVPIFPRMPLGWILHVQEGNGSPFNLFNRNVKGSRKFSHGWIAKSGRAEFYGSLFRESWAQVDGNPDYWSFETEGFATEPLTSAQMWTLARIHAMLQLAAHADYSHLAEKPGERGVGTHAMGGAAWGGHACPGSIRAGQREKIIDRASTMKIRWK